MAGMFVHLISFTAYLSFSQTWHVFAFMPFGVLSAVTVPALQGIMSRRVPDNAQGELQGVLASLGALATIISPLVMTQTFGYFTSDAAPFRLPGAPFAVAAVFTALAIVVFRQWRATEYQQT